MRRLGVPLLMRLAGAGVGPGGGARGVRGAPIAGPRRDTVLLEGMEFFGYHGVLPEERRMGQKFVVDVRMGCCLKAAGEGDDLSATVDYSKVYESVKTIVEGRPLELVESVAERVAAAVLDGEGRAEDVWVRVTKPHVALGGVLGGAGVEIFRTKA